ncbi:MAG: thioredoxin domain-containing protein [Myxococcales bacterium]
MSDIRWTVPPGAPEWPAGLRGELDRALAAMGPGYAPRTHHLRPDGGPRWTNRLVRESSPYLLQHAHNPVDWHPWGDEAFALARALDRPVLLSIGYATCHWCHVMEVESFEDPEIADYVNSNYVAIKVDREQRPDVDAVYMAAVQMMTGHGGWPMTTVLTHDREPFFGGTYFPARDGDRGSPHGFLTILQALEHTWRGDRARVVEHGRRVAQEIDDRLRRARPGDLPGPEVLGRLTAELAGVYDRTHGGFGGPPKFPQPSLIEALLHAGRRDPGALSMAVHTLDRMAAGGMRDHAGGGFHRYSVDGRWLVPHFEKMLYDNAQLASAYLHAWAVTGDERHADVARDTLDYLVREMVDPCGGLWSATDADSRTPDGHLEEGWFFTWTPDELREVLGSEAAHVEEWSAVTERGNFEGRTILHAARGPRDPEALRRCLVRLREARRSRPAPLLDDKIIAAWNGLAISALARGGLLLGEPRYTAAAEAAARFAEDVLIGEGRLRRCARGGVASHVGLLDDHAALGLGLLDLFEATGSGLWLERALWLAEELESRFLLDGAYAMTPSDGEALLAREVPAWDGAEPSGNGLAALLHVRLHGVTGDERHRERAVRTLRAFGDLVGRHPSGVARMVVALDLLLARPVQVAVIRPRGGDDAALVAAFARAWAPRAALVRVEEGVDVRHLAPWLAGKDAKGGATAWVCEEGTCQAPTTEPAVLESQLRALMSGTGGGELV